MDSRERVRRAMRHETPDRVPVMCQLALGHYLLHSQQAPAEIWFDSDVFAEVLLQFQERYGFDGVLVNLPGRPDNWQAYLCQRRAGVAGEELVWEGGLTTRFVRDDNPQADDGSGQALPRADYLRVDPDDPATYRIPGYVWNTWHAPHLWDVPDTADLTDRAQWPAWSTRALRQARAWGPRVSVHAELFSPFTHLMELFGYESALLALLDAPDTCHALLDVFTRMVIAQLETYGACDPDAILISSAFAGAGFISRPMYGEFVLPYERRVSERARVAGIPVYTHTCGAIGDRLDLMERTGIDGIDTLDPPPLGTVDLGQAKAEYGSRLFFKGNLDAVHDMLYADETRFEQAVRQRIAIGCPGSGYILSSACSVSPHVCPERLRRMQALAVEFGQYPR